ncbi:Uncharacterised protein [Salmonella enterica subsp. enterica serovar Typhi]|nr:Uncharacterised protein [Salmonella enterica subsp. enterica serovar Typhi]
MIGFVLSGIKSDIFTLAKGDHAGENRVSLKTIPLLRPRASPRRSSTRKIRSDGTQNEEGPVSRESVEYFSTQSQAEHALKQGTWSQREQA